MVIASTSPVELRTPANRRTSFGLWSLMNPRRDGDSRRHCPLRAGHIPRLWPADHPSICWVDWATATKPSTIARSATSINMIHLPIGGRSLGNLSFGGYCWSAQPVDDSHLLLAGRADGTIHDEIWLVHLPDLSTELLGHAVIQATCAPLAKVGPRKWWLIGGEPDSQKHRTDRVTVISLP